MTIFFAKNYLFERFLLEKIKRPLRDVSLKNTLVNHKAVVTSDCFFHAISNADKKISTKDIDSTCLLSKSC